jgi:hypothetical protein
MNKIDVLLSVGADDKKSLVRTISCLMKQVQVHVRLLVVIDCSLSFDVVELLPNHSIILHNSSRFGLTKSLKRLESFIESEYIARIDLGDHSDEFRFIKQIEFLRQHKDHALIGCFSKLHFISRMKKEEYVRYSCEPSSTEEIRKTLVRRNPMVHGSIMIRKSMFRKVGGYRTGLKVAQDLDLYFRLLEVGEIAKIPEILHDHYFYEGTSTTLVNSKASILSAMKSRFRYLRMSQKASIAYLMGGGKDSFLLLLPVNLLALINRSKWKILDK